MKKNYKELNNLLLDFIPERFTITCCKANFNSKGITSFTFRLYLPERGFYLACNICYVMLFIGSIPEIRVLSKDYDKIKKVYDKMVIDYERGAL
mgnify:CR=1 FL=1